MNNSSYYRLIIFFMIIFSSCSKVQDDEPHLSCLYPEEAASLYFGFPMDTADFTVLFRHRIRNFQFENLYEYYKLFTIIAFNRDRAFLGNFHINDSVLHYYSNVYDWGHLRNDDPAFLINSSFRLKLDGNVFPAFQRDFALPDTTTLNFKGLVNNKVDLKKGFNLSFEYNEQDPDMKYLLILSGERFLYENNYQYYKLSAGVKSIDVNSKMLKNFKGYDQIHVCLVKGKAERMEIEGRTIDFKITFESQRDFYIR